MPDTELTLKGWETFYVIIGSASAALTGLMFVVVTLMSDSTQEVSEDGVSAFATPNVLHFCAVLLVSAILTAPWSAIWQPAWAIALVGAAGLVYVFIVLQRARRQTAYTPVFEDWLWHFILAFIAYATLAAAGFVEAVHAAGALFAVAGATTLLLFVGIHNAWDTVTYMALERLRARQAKAREKAVQQKTGK
jgi:fucose 4-O-acetylase-like acetyltransferase